MDQADQGSESVLERHDITKWPWCPYTGNLKQVIGHMESAHYQRWYELALYPPIAGGC
jgi:hypothetical protein